VDELALAGDEDEVLLNASSESTEANVCFLFFHYIVTVGNAVTKCLLYFFGMYTYTVLPEKKLTTFSLLSSTRAVHVLRLLTHALLRL